MALTVRNKIWLGTLFLFALLLLTGGTSIFFMIRIKSDSKNILQDNYETLSYCHTMQQQLALLNNNYRSAINEFDKALSQQEKNITEPGEGVATDSLRMLFGKLKTGDTTRTNLKMIQNEILQILYLNMNAISTKNLKAKDAADNALTIILSIAAAIFLLSLSFIVNFPSVVTAPINKLMEGIHEIANKNYQHRVHIDNKDEFGQLAESFNDMAAKLENFENSNLNKLMFEKNRAEAVINSLKDPSIGIDKNNIVLFANAQALQLLGLQPADIVGRPVNEVKQKNDLFRYLIDNEDRVPFKVVVDNRENYFTKEMIEVEQGDAKNKVIVLKNITSFKELDVAKTNFIATVSHELKTPLASSDLSLKLLEDERVSHLTPAQKNLIASLKNDNRRMLKILSELLNMSQVESGRIQLVITMIDPNEIINSSILAVSAAAREKEIGIKNISGKNLPQIKADADKTTWVLNNLLTNAIKYSYHNSSIEVLAEQQEGQIVFSVTDHGAGIDTRYIPRLFERYFQVPGSKEKGTGLGLAISKDFIEAQRGRIWVTSEIAKGSVFYFSLPVQ
ncbi:MAG TPA: ATP-binding protein [Chitinophagaceae bacterium]|nr:ATP-binding protein [Chitinophagaceae bacterium]